MQRTILSTFLCQALFAQSQQPPDPSTMARVEGRVINAVTGEPLRKAEVKLGGQYSTTDGNGHFVIDQVAPGSYILTAQHQNFAVQGYGARHTGLPGTKLTLSAGQQVSNIEMKLIPFGVITGKVFDQDGDPVAGVQIMVMKWGFMRGGRQLMPWGGGSSSDDRGEFRIYNLPAGRYFVAARPARSDVDTIVRKVNGKAIPTVQPVREAYGVTFYPSAPEVTAAVAVMLTAGQEASGRDIQLRKTRVVTVEGKVAGMQKGQRFALTIQQLDGSTGTFGMGKVAAVQEDGSFIFQGVATGRYTLMATINNRVVSHQEISVGDSELTGIVITMSAPGSVKGRVLFEGGGAAKTPALKGLRVSLTPADTMNTPNDSTADDGSFEMEDVPAGRFKVNCSPLEGTYLKTIRWSGQVSNDGMVEMTGSGASTLDLEFAATTAEIDGDVKTGDDPAPGASVLLVPASRREPDFRLAITDQNGHFAAKGVAPGGYTVLAADTAIYSMPDAALVKALEKFSAFTTVDQNGQATVSLKLIPEAEIDAVQ